MNNITGNEIRTKYLEFLKSKGHAVVPSASIIPLNDPTTLFTTAGMQPMMPYLLGETHPQGTRIVDSQRCFRAEDIEEVGDNRHTTAFEMLGNWSFGDYFKKEQLNWFFEFLTKEVGLDPNKLYITVFGGNKEIPRDTETAELWQEIFKSRGIEAKVIENAAEEGMQDGRIFYYPEKKNWWSRAGVPSKMPAGEPGGPDSEVFYEFTQINHNPAFGSHCHVNCDCGRYLELGNSVFMQYQKMDDGSFSELKNKNIDFGGGLERILAAAYDNPDIFLTDLFWPLIQKTAHLSHQPYHDGNQRYYRIIADHVKGAVMLTSDGVIPSNKAQGYILRRIIRRAVRCGQLLGISQPFIAEVAKEVQNIYSKAYPQVDDNKIIEILAEEEQKFRETLDRGITEVKKYIQGRKKSDESVPNSDEIATQAFTYFQSNGLPIDIFLDDLDQAYPEQLNLDQKQEIQQKFTSLMNEHRELSRTASAGMFKGGLADHSEQVIQYHTTTHLLQQALRDVLGEQVVQKGSNITGERLRFDFTHTERLTEEQKQKIEQIVNEKIKEALPVTSQIIPTEEAMKLGAIGLFGEKYGDTVKVYSIGPAPTDDKPRPRNEVYSREFCGGPHVSNTSEIKGTFKIQKDEKIAKDVVRIKGVLES